MHSLKVNVIWFVKVMICAMVTSLICLGIGELVESPCLLNIGEWVIFPYRKLPCNPKSHARPVGKGSLFLLLKNLSCNQICQLPFTFIVHSPKVKMIWFVKLMICVNGNWLNLARHG